MPHAGLVLLALALTLGACAPGASLPAGPAASQEEIQTISGREIAPAELDRFLATQMDSLSIPGLSIAVINRGRVVYHRTLGVTDLGAPAPVDGQTIFEAASLTKPVFAYLTLRLVEQGVLELDTPLYRYASLDSLWNGWYRGIASDDRHRAITARTVLSHTTGLPNWRWNNADRKLDIKFVPGTRFSYSGEGYEMLADVIAQRMEIDMDGMNAAFRREVAQPLGMTQASIVADSSLAARTANGHEEGKPSGREWCCDGRSFMASGGLHTEALSYARFLIGVMRGEGLSAALVEEMLREQVQLPADAGQRTEDGITAWGMGFAIRPSPYGRLHLHGGTNTGFRAGFLFQREQQNGYVLFTNSDRGDELNRRMAAVFAGGT